jgi:holin-like protein
VIAGLTLILAAQLAGEALARGAGWPVPGPVIGMALLLALLVLKDRLPARRVPAALAGGGLEATGRGLLAHLSLLFVPAGVGVVQRLDVLTAHGPALAAALVVSTLAALAATAGTFLLVARLMERGRGTRR